MNQPFDPYTPPQAVPPVPRGLAGSDAPVPWESGEVLNLAMGRFKRFWFVLVIAYLINFVVTQIVNQGPVLAWRFASPVENKTLAVLVQIASSIAGMGVGAFLIVGLLRVCLDAARGRTPQLGTLFLGGDRFLPMLGLYLLMTVVIGIGLLLLVVPGVVLMLGFAFAPFYIVDANLGPVAAMRASWAATTGQKGRLFGLSLLSVGILLLGVLACGVGVVPAASFAYVAWAIAYSRASGREPAMADPAWS